MSNETFNWDDENSDFNDIPDEVNGNASPAVQPTFVRTAAQAVAPKPKTPVPAPVATPEEEAEVEAILGVAASDDEDEEDFSLVLSDARLRLEQGRLYEMVMNHNLFDGLEADSKAIKAVQKQIRKFAKEQMEIMLGMRQETPKEVSVAVALPFNDLEIQVLKKLASAASKGATETAEPAQVVSAPVVKRETLSPISGTPKKATISPVKKAPVATAKPLPAKPKSPLKRANDAVKQQILAEEGVPEELLEEDYKPLDKHPSLLTEAEVIERNRQSMERLQKRKQPVKSASALPHPSYEQQEMLYAQRLMEEKANGKGTVSTIMALLNAQPKKS